MSSQYNFEAERKQDVAVTATTKQPHSSEVMPREVNPWVHGLPIEKKEPDIAPRVISLSLDTAAGLHRFNIYGLPAYPTETPIDSSNWFSKMSLSNISFSAPLYNPVFTGTEQNTVLQLTNTTSVVSNVITSSLYDLKKQDIFTCSFDFQVSGPAGGDAVYFYWGGTSAPNPLTTPNNCRMVIFNVTNSTGSVHFRNEANVNVAVNCRSP